MLVYVNQFNLVGENSCDEAFRLVSQWLSRNLKERVTPNFLKSGKERKFRFAHIRTYVADNLEPACYSILFTHPDKNVRGRQWITEIGIKIENNITTISILLETSDISTRVREIAKSTKPHLVALINQNKLLSKDTIGLNAIKLDSNLDDFRKLYSNIIDKNRNFPIILISKRKSINQFLVEPQKLQEQLLGLAQVVYLDDDVNVFELEREIGKEFSVWDGSVRIIYPKQYTMTRLLRSYELTALSKETDNIYHELLSFVTHFTNGYYKRMHLRPSDIRSKRYKDQKNILKEKLDNSNNIDYEALFYEACKELEEQEKVLENFKNDIELIEYENLELSEKNKDVLRENESLKECVNAFNKSTANKDYKSNAVIQYGDEIDLYPNEIKELVIQIIDDYFTNTEMSPNDRQRKILEDILSKNKSSNKAKEILERIKSIFLGYSGITPKIRSELKALGFEVVEAEHNQVKFINDPRFSSTFSKTPSDRRVSKNIPKHIKKALLY